MAFQRLTDEQEALLCTLFDLRQAGTIPSDSFAFSVPLTGKLWLARSKPYLAIDGSLAALDAIAKLGYLDGARRPSGAWHGSFTRKGQDYVRWRRRNPALRFAGDRAALIWKVPGVVGLAAKAPDVLNAIKALHW